MKAAGIARLRLFGSVARSEAGNDVDLATAFDRALSFIDLVGLEDRLSDLLGRKVDLAQDKMLKPRVRANVEREAVLCLLKIRYNPSTTFSIISGISNSS